MPRQQTKKNNGGGHQPNNNNKTIMEIDTNFRGPDPTAILPTKVYKHSSPAHPTTDNRHERNAVYHAYPHLGVRYTAQPVVSWIESLVAATEMSEQLQHQAQQQKQQQDKAAANQQGVGNPSTQEPQEPQQPQQQQQPPPGPITLQDVHLSVPSNVPPSAPWRIRHNAVSPSKQSAAIEKADQHIIAAAAAAGMGTNHHGQESAQASPVPSTWDLSFLLQRDPKSQEFVRQIHALAAKWEDLCLNHKMSTGDNDGTAALESQYRMIPSRLEFTSGRIVGQYPYGTSLEHGEPRELLDKLYEDTIETMYKLLMASIDQKEQDERSKCSSPTPTIETADADPEETSSPKKIPPWVAPYMTAWLLENWANPYPDDDGMEQLASDLKVPPKTVSNWLINARTRKWRPAIVKAFHLSRPVHLLEQDSKAIFTRKHVQDVDEALRNEKEQFEQRDQEQQQERQSAMMGPPPQQPFQVPVGIQQQHPGQAVHTAVDPKLPPHPSYTQNPPPPPSHMPQSMQPPPKRFKPMDL